MIETYAFGEITINSVAYKSDVKIISRAVVPDWRRNKGHRVDVDDLSDILASRPDVLVIGQGKFGMMKVAPALKDHLKNNGIDLIATSTSEAVNIYNRLFRGGKNICAAFHLTC